MYSIAIIDDSPTDIRLLRLALDKAGLQYECKQFIRGHVSMESLLTLKEPLDLIITDGEVPGMDSEEFVTRLKQSPTLGGVPVVVLSGISDPAFVKRMLERGVEDYCMKPHDLDGWYQLGNRLKHLIAKPSE